MKNSNMNARNAVSGSTEFPWKWSLLDLEKRPKHGYTVFSCFSCGGGSSMGYKLPDEKIPEELFYLDVLDGSPPCSVFSTAGSREEGWNTEKVFREGQAKQRLDDLFLYFIAIAKRLQPKVVIAENVKGIIIGNASFLSRTGKT